MKLKKNIYKTNKDFHKKFENCKPSFLQRVIILDYFFWHLIKNEEAEKILELINKLLFYRKKNT